MHRTGARYSARRATARRQCARNARSNRKKAVVHSFFAFHVVFLRVSSVRTNRAEICTRTSVQVAIGLFPIDSVRAEFLLLSLLFFAHCLHLPFTCTFRSFFSRYTSVAFSFSPALTLSLPLSLLLGSIEFLICPLLPFLFCSPAFCNLDTDEIKETLY